MCLRGGVFPRLMTTKRMTTIPMTTMSGESTGSTTELILVRHGETAWNHERRIQGQIDIPLSEVGQRQAELAGRRFMGLAVAAVHTSDLLRASQTAAPIAAVLGLPMVLDTDLRERHYGTLQGLRYADIARDQPERFARMQARDLTDDFEGGESIPAFHSRVRARLTAIADAYPGKRVVVVAHGGVLDGAWRLVTGAALDGVRDVGLFNASLNTIARTPAGWRLVRWGDVDHLSDSADDLDPRGRPSSGAMRIA